MTALLEPCKDIVFCEQKVKILSAMTEANANEIKALAKELAE